MKIEDIDTSRQAQNFAEQILKEPRTFFLQGSWGSGKTKYLEKVKDEMHDSKFIELKLWKPKDGSSFAKKLFAVTNPFLSMGFTGFGWLFICVSVVASIVLAVKGISVENDARISIPLSFAIIAVIMTTLYGFLQSKWFDADRFRMWISKNTLTGLKIPEWIQRALRCKPRILRRKPRILVIDDFDRLDEGVQKELYMLFNTIHGSTRVIFVGDLQKLANADDSFLGKIIDVKVALPFQLRSQNIVRRIHETVIAEVDPDANSAAVQELFAEEGHTARDANQFLSYCESEFITQEKKGKVQTDQELFIIYLYLFHPDKYRKLIQGWLPEEDPNKADSISHLFTRPDATNDSDSTDGKTSVTNWMDYMFQPRKTNPLDFRKNSSAYFINELATNHSLIELQQYMESDERLRSFFRFKEPAYAEMDTNHDQPGERTRLTTDYEEFFEYIDRMKDEEYFTYQKKLEVGAVSSVHSEVRHEPNQLTQLVFKKKIELINKLPPHNLSDDFRDRNRERDREIISEFEEMFNNAEKHLNETIPFTERMYHYRSYLNFDDNGILESSLQEHFNKIAEEREKEEDFGKKDYDAEALIVQLGYCDLMTALLGEPQNINFQEKVKSIEKLKDVEYQAFWNAYYIHLSTGTGHTLQGGGTLGFDYNNGRPYKEQVQSRLTQAI